MWGNNMNSPLLELHIREVRNELYRQAKRHRLLQEIQANQPGMWQRLRYALADFFIRLGVWLKGRHLREDGNFFESSASPSPIVVRNNT